MPNMLAIRKKYEWIKDEVEEDLRLRSTLHLKDFSLTNLTLQTILTMKIIHTVFDLETKLADLFCRSRLPADRWCSEDSPFWIASYRPTHEPKLGHDISYKRAATKAAFVETSLNSSKMFLKILNPAPNPKETDVFAFSIQRIYSAIFYIDTDYQFLDTSTSFTELRTKKTPWDIKVLFRRWE